MPKEEKSMFHLVSNDLLHYWPDEIAVAFWRFSTDMGRNPPSLNEKRLEQCAASLARSFPYYKAKFENEPDCRLGFTKHFFAGACGFGSTQLTDYPITRKDAVRLFGEEYVISFDECSREHTESCNPEEKGKTILENRYFGDFVAAFRWLNIVFRTVLDSSAASSGDEEMRLRFRAVLLLGYLMDKDKEYDLQQYIQPTLAKETSENPALVENFVRYYVQLSKSEDTDYSGVAESLYATVLKDTETAYQLRYTPRRCAHCNGYYFDDPFNTYELHDCYCSPACQLLENHLRQEFESAKKALKKSQRRRNAGKKVLTDSYLDELLKSFTYGTAQSKYRKLCQSQKAPLFNEYYGILFISLDAKNDTKSAFVVRPILHEFLHSDLGSEQSLQEYRNLIQALENCFGTEELDEFQREWEKPLKDAFDKIYFKIY